MIVLIAVSLILLKKFKPSEKTVFTIAAVICLLSEFAKIYAVTRMLPMADGSGYVPFFERRELPLHLCSIQIFFIFYIRFFAKEGEKKQKILGFMFPSMILGSFFALLLPSVFNVVPVEKAFTSLQVYQTFIYHAMLMVLGIYIYVKHFSEWKTKNYLYTLGLLFGFSVASIYVNSLLAYLTFDSAHQYASIEKMSNFFFVVKTPIGIPLNEKWQWLIYIIILIVLAFILVGAFYIPAFRRDLKERNALKK